MPNKRKGNHSGNKGDQIRGRNNNSGNFANNRERAKEAGRKGGEH